MESWKPIQAETGHRHIEYQSQIPAAFKQLQTPDFYFLPVRFHPFLNMVPDLGLFRAPGQLFEFQKFDIIGYVFTTGGIG